MRTIESFEVYVHPIQEVIEELLLRTLFGQSEPLPNEVRRLATLATGQGGLGNRRAFCMRMRASAERQ